MKQPSSSFEDKLAKSGPRKPLALDGGGIRGVITLEVLAEIERQLKNKLRRGDDFVLTDYFDYIARTSKGAVITTCLALGMLMKEIARSCKDGGPAMFDKANLVHRFSSWRPSKPTSCLEISIHPFSFQARTILSADIHQ